MVSLTYILQQEPTKKSLHTIASRTRCELKLHTYANISRGSFFALIVCWFAPSSLLVHRGGSACRHDLAAAAASTNHHASSVRQKWNKVTQCMHPFGIVYSPSKIVYIVPTHFPSLLLDSLSSLLHSDSSHRPGLQLHAVFCGCFCEANRCCRPCPEAAFAQALPSVSGLLC